jgi:Protein of unknown function (DUF4065)
MVTFRSSGCSFDMRKLEEAVHYICATCTASDGLGAVKLNKILYYADMINYAVSGSPITGATYVKRLRGPCPKQILPAIEYIKQTHRLETRSVSVFDLTRREFDAHGSTDLSIFTPDEIDHLNQTMRFVCNHSAADISDASHTVVWDVADMGEELPYETFLVSYPGELDDEGLQRAADVIAKAEQMNSRSYA